MSKKKYTQDDLVKHYFSGSTEEQKTEESGGSTPRGLDRGRMRAQKLPRINMAFTEENLEYLHIMSAVTKKSITRYVNDLIEEQRELQGDAIIQLKRIMKEIKQ